MPESEFPAIAIAIVEDDATIRQGLKSLVSSTEGFSCTGVYPTAENALADIPENAPDIVLMDIHLPGMSGVECVRQLRSRVPSIQVMMLTVYENDENIFAALKAGANSYMVKRTKPDALVNAIRELHGGGAPMSAEIARKVVQTFHQQRTLDEAAAESLTEREREILGYLAQGMRYKEIADRLFISTHTVRTHIHRVYEKLHVHTRTEAIIKVLPR